MFSILTFINYYAISKVIEQTTFCGVFMKDS